MPRAPLYPTRPSDEVLCQLYLDNGWEDPGNEPFPDPAIANDVWDMLSAQDLDQAVENIRYWGPSATRREEVASPRLRAGVVDATIEAAYAAGYEHGWARNAFRPFPATISSDPVCLLWFKAGYADGNWDAVQKNAYKTTQVGPGTEQADEEV